MRTRIALVMAGLLFGPTAPCGEAHAQQADWEAYAQASDASAEMGQPAAGQLWSNAKSIRGSHAPNDGGRAVPGRARPGFGGRGPAVAEAGSVRPVAAWQPDTLPSGQYESAAAAAATTPQSYDNSYPPTYPVMVDANSELLKELYRRVRDLEQDRQNRNLIDRAREAETARRGVDVTDEQWNHTWGGRVMGDWVNWADDSQFIGQSNFFEFRRLRLSISGEGYGVYDYRLQVEFAPEVELEAELENGEWQNNAARTVTGDIDLGGFGVELKDAYVGIHDVPWLGYIRFGHFKVPFSLSELTSSNYITFMERALPHLFAPGREVGVTAYNYSAGQNVTWAFGAFFDEMDEMEHVIEDNNQGMRLAGRLTWTPCYDEPAQGRYLVHTGIGYVYTRPRGEDERLPDPALPARFMRPVRFRARPEIHRGDRLIDTRIERFNPIGEDDINGHDDLDAQQYHVLGGELAWVHGSLSMQGEMIWTSIEEAGGGSTDLYGVYVYASYFLTGEHRPYNRTSGTFGRVVPYENFWIVNTPGGCCAGWGAWEIAARWSYLDFTDADGQQLNDFTAGVNWYWNPHTRLMFNWIHPFAFNSPASAAVEAEGDVIAMRLQVAF